MINFETYNLMRSWTKATWKRLSFTLAFSSVFQIIRKSRAAMFVLQLHSTVHCVYRELNKLFNKFLKIRKYIRLLRDRLRDRARQS